MWNIKAKDIAITKLVIDTIIEILESRSNAISFVNKALGCKPNAIKTKPKDIISTCNRRFSDPPKIPAIFPLNINTNIKAITPIQILTKDNDANSIFSTD